MTARRNHIAEMQHALAHNCSLEEARRALAKLRWRARDAARQKAEHASVHSRVSLGDLPPAGQSQHYWWNRD